MKNIQPVDNLNLKNLKTLFYLIPIIGFFPSLWTIYSQGAGGRDKGAGTKEQVSRGAPTCAPSSREEVSKEQLAVSRLSVTLAGSWLLSYLLLGAGAEMSEFLTLRFLILNSLLTSGYFLVSIWLMVRLASRKSVRLPGFSQLARMLNK